MKVKSLWVLIGILIGTLGFYGLQNVDSKVAQLRNTTDNSSNSKQRPISKKLIADLNGSSNDNSVSLGTQVYEPAVLGAQTVIEKLQPDIKKEADLINKIRLEFGLDPLTLSNPLSTSAKILSQGGRSDTSQIVESEGFNNWKFLSVNSISGMKTLEEAISFWMASPSHRDNILSKQPKEYGVGNSQTTWVVIFGTK